MFMGMHAPFRLPTLNILVSQLMYKYNIALPPLIFLSRYLCIGHYLSLSLYLFSNSLTDISTFQYPLSLSTQSELITLNFQQTMWSVNQTGFSSKYIPFLPTLSSLHSLSPPTIPLLENSHFFLTFGLAPREILGSLA